MYDLYDRIQWQEISDLLNSGHPSILQQLIFVNALSLIIIVVLSYRRKEKSPSRPKYFIQELLLLANMIIVSENQIGLAWTESIWPMIHEFRQYAS